MLGNDTSAKVPLDPTSLTVLTPPTNGTVVCSAGSCVYTPNALAEYRSLSVKEGGRRQGALVGVDRDIGRNFRVGVGYNFTDFSDKLTDFDYDHRGWFLNVVGSY